MHFVIVEGSDAGIAAGLRAHELDPTCEITLVLAEYLNIHQLKVQVRIGLRPFSESSAKIIKT